MASQGSLFSRLFSFLHPNGKVILKIDGTAKDYNVTYKYNDAAVCHVEHVKNGWKHRIPASEGDYVYLSAQANELSAHVFVEIHYHGKVYSNAEARGDYALAQTGGCIC